MKTSIKQLFTRKTSTDSSACGITDIGLRRQNNEDCFLIRPERNVFILADGMGGHNAGEIASMEAVNTLICFSPGILLRR